MKKGDLQRERILETAEELFYTKGYEETSVQDVLDALELSKGGFYHHFDSKSALLIAVCERRAQERLTKEATELRASRAEACARMNRLLGLAGFFEREEPRFAAMLMRLKLVGGDVQVRDCMNRVVMEQLLPLADELVLTGIAEGVFHTRYPNTVGRMLLLLARQLDDEFWRMLLTEVKGAEDVLDVVEMIDTYRDAVERMLNAPYGSMHIVEVDVLLNNYRAARNCLKDSTIGGKI